MPIELWKPLVRGYEISSHGRVRNSRTGRVLKQGDANGYSRVTPSIKGKSINVSVHKAVAKAFIGRCPKNREVNHKNGNKKYNNVINLEYMTRKQNVQHAYDTGLGVGLRGENSGSSKLTYRQVRRIRIRYREGRSSQAELAERYGVTQSAVKNIVNNKTWSKESKNGPQDTSPSSDND